MTRIRCQCGLITKIDDSFAGMEVDCIKCGFRGKVPEPMFEIVEAKKPKAKQSSGCATFIIVILVIWAVIAETRLQGAAARFELIGQFMDNVHQRLKIIGKMVTQ